MMKWPASSLRLKIQAGTYVRKWINIILSLGKSIPQMRNYPITSEEGYFCCESFYFLLGLSGNLTHIAICWIWILEQQLAHLDC